MPKRNIPKSNGLVSPANGKVIKIMEIGLSKKWSPKEEQQQKKMQQKNSICIRKGILGKVNALVADTVKKGHLIIIVMNPFNVHYQRAPTDGKVKSVKHKKGKLLNAIFKARNLKPTLENEKNEIIISTKYGRIKVVQVAGIFARRCFSFVKKNQNIKKGQIIGVVKMGSQVCVVIPDSLKPMVFEGQYVVDGETIIAVPTH
ncbi:MAG: phosphatidylserine decarboxylase [Candidatus Woesearchaeota archaeon]|nr:phosphatidylserine decarboxylase [Candidatus Woesearchaeota archaeon]